MNLTVCDDVISYTDRGWIEEVCMTSTLRLGWHDDTHHEYGGVNLFSGWSKDDLVRSKLWGYFQDCIEQTPWFTNSEFTKCVLNLVRPNDVHLIHSHPMSQVALYYVNLEWRDGWYGETLFYSENTKDIVFTTPFVPGRIILFDGNIPHAIRPQSTVAPKYRLTISTFFE